MVKQLSGVQIGNIKVLYRSNCKKNGRCIWTCKCICGKIFEAATYTLTAKNKRNSCGCCEWHIKHNEAYVSWMGMKSRCNNLNNKDYSSYGGRGIYYDIKWEDFVEFYKDMGDPPFDQITGERLSLDRIDNDGNYCKSNCKWSDRSEQQLNKRSKLENIGG